MNENNFFRKITIASEENKIPKQVLLMCIMLSNEQETIDWLHEIGLGELLAKREELISLMGSWPLFTQTPQFLE